MLIVLYSQLIVDIDFFNCVLLVFIGFLIMIAVGLVYLLSSCKASLSSDSVTDLVIPSASVVEFEARHSARMPKLMKSKTSCHCSEQGRVNSLWLSGSRMLPAASRFYAVHCGLVPGIYRS